MKKPFSPVIKRLGTKTKIMQILFYTEVEVCEKPDFNHNGVNYHFKSKNMLQAVDTVTSHIDRIDNDYTGDPEPLLACVYFGDYDIFSFDYDDNHVEHDGSVLFAKKRYKDKDSDTVIVPNNTDMDELREAYENHNLCRTWLELCEILGEEAMENAHIITTGDVIFMTKAEIIELQKDCKWVYDLIYPNHINSL